MCVWQSNVEKPDLINLSCHRRNADVRVYFFTRDTIVVRAYDHLARLVRFEQVIAGSPVRKAAHFYTIRPDIKHAGGAIISKQDMCPLIHPDLWRKIVVEIILCSTAHSQEGRLYPQYVSIACRER